MQQTREMNKVTPRSGAYWGELDPREHAVQIYRDEGTLLDSLEGFIGAGLRTGESVIVIATGPHLHELEIRLRKGWHDLDRARWEDRYIALLAGETLERFCKGGNVDAETFGIVVGDLLRRARGKGNRPVRAFGEMVALLWAEGRADAALELEALWTGLQIAEKFPLFCAYPRRLFQPGDELRLNAVCGAHTHVVPGYIA